MLRLRMSPTIPMRLANRMATPFSVIAVALVALLGVPTTEATTSSHEDPLHQEVTDYSSGGTDVFRALEEASFKYDIPLGIEADERGQGAKHISVSISKGTVADIFNALVQQAPNYKWVESGGVVNVLPQQGGDSVLDLKIARFHVTHATPDGLHTAIRSLPEVRAWLNQHHLTEHGPVTGNVLIGRNGKTDQPHVSLSVKNITLREIMNTIVKKHGFHVWFVGRYGDHNQYLSIGIH